MTRKQTEPSIELLSAYLDEDLPPRQRREVVSAVLASPVVQERLGELQAIRQVLSAPSRIDRKIDVTDAVMAAIARRAPAAAGGERSMSRLRYLARLLMNATGYAYCCATGADARGGAATVLEMPFLSWVGPPTLAS